MRKLSFYTNCLYQQVLAELRLFWRSQETIFLTFLVPMLAMALFIYLSREGMLESVFNILLRGVGSGGAEASKYAPITFMTLGMITYCAIAAAFESPMPKLVRARAQGVLKRLGGTPLRAWTLLMAKALGASLLVFAEVLLIFVVGLVSKELEVKGSWWDLGIILLLGTFMLSGLAFALSNLTSTHDSAIVVVHAVYIPILLLCGAFVPVEAMPKALRAIADVLPLTYFVNLFRGVMVEGGGILDNVADLFLLLVWTVGAWVLAVKTFRWR